MYFGRSSYKMQTLQSVTSKRKTLVLSNYSIVSVICVLLCLLDIGYVASMSLDRLGIDLNEINTQQQQESSNDNSNNNVVVEDRILEAVPAGGNTDMYVLIPSNIANDMQSVEKNVIETQSDEESANVAAPGDMLMMETNNEPALQIISLPLENVQQEQVQEIAPTAEIAMENTAPIALQLADQIDDTMLKEESQADEIPVSLSNDIKEPIADALPQETTSDDIVQETVAQQEADPTNDVETQSLTDMIADIVNETMSSELAADEAVLNSEKLEDELETEVATNVADEIASDAKESIESELNNKNTEEELENELISQIIAEDNEKETKEHAEQNDKKPEETIFENVADGFMDAIDDMVSEETQDNVAHVVPVQNEIETESTQQIAEQSTANNDFHVEMPIEIVNPTTSPLEEESESTKTEEEKVEDAPMQILDDIIEEAVKEDDTKLETAEMTANVEQPVENEMVESVPDVATEDVSQQIDKVDEQIQADIETVAEDNENIAGTSDNEENEQDDQLTNSEIVMESTHDEEEVVKADAELNAPALAAAADLMETQSEDKHEVFEQMEINSNLMENENTELSANVDNGANEAMLQMPGEQPSNNEVSVNSDYNAPNVQGNDLDVNLAEEIEKELEEHKSTPLETVNSENESVPEDVLNEHKQDESIPTESIPNETDNKEIHESEMEVHESEIQMPNNVQEDNQEVSSSSLTSDDSLSQITTDEEQEKETTSTEQKHEENEQTSASEVGQSIEAGDDKLEEKLPENQKLEEIISPADNQIDTTENETNKSDLPVENVVADMQETNVQEEQNVNEFVPVADEVNEPTVDNNEMQEIVQKDESLEENVVKPTETAEEVPHEEIPNELVNAEKVELIESVGQVEPEQTELTKLDTQHPVQETIPMDLAVNGMISNVNVDKSDDSPIQQDEQKPEQPSDGTSLLTTIIQIPQTQNDPVELPTEIESQKVENELPATTTPTPTPMPVIEAIVPQQSAMQINTPQPLNVVDSVLNYVNASFVHLQQQHTNNRHEQPLKQETEEDITNSKLRRYDGAQVWRIVVQSDKDKQLADELQTKYGGQLWKEVKQEVDYLLKPQVLADAERHIRAANLSRIVLIDNLQKVIEVENPSADKIALLQNRKGHRLTWQAYHRLDDIHGFFDYLAKTYPDICSVEIIGYSIQKRPLKILKISNGNAKNPGFWIDGGMHAREWISPATVTYIANQLAEGWDDLPEHMRNINWYIHAVANPDGYEYSHTTDRLWRKNMRSHGRQCPGVDLNRNFGYKWGGKGTSANPCAQTYRGNKAFSEPETFYISKFISNYPRDTFHSYVSFHSYGQYILYPWGYDYHLTNDRSDLDRVARQAGTSITRDTGVKYTVGSSATTLYPAAGGSDDWAKGFAGIKYAYTIEMGDTGRYGFILPASFIEYNGKDGYTFVDTIARAIMQGQQTGRRRAIKSKKSKHFLV